MYLCTSCTYKIHVSRPIFSHSACVDESSRDESAAIATNNATPPEAAHTRVVCPCCGIQHPKSSIQETNVERESRRFVYPEEDVLHDMFAGSNISDMTPDEQEFLQHLLSTSTQL